jgi:hypothetical protein
LRENQVYLDRKIVEFGQHLREATRQIVDLEVALDGTQAERYKIFTN